jgi:hypothetical protein
MNRPAPQTLRRHFFVALGHAIHVTWPVCTEAANNSVSVRTRLAEGLPRVQGDRVQPDWQNRVIDPPQAQIFPSTLVTSSAAVAAYRSSSWLVPGLVAHLKTSWESLCTS